MGVKVKEKIPGSVRKGTNTRDQGTDHSYFLNRLFLWIEPVIIEFRCVHFFGGFHKRHII